MKSINIVYPHQLFKASPLFDYEATFYLVEEILFFNQYPFHKQKIAFHRASMKMYEAFLISKGYDVNYVSATNALADTRQLIPYLVKKGVKHVNVIDPVDDWLFKRLEMASKEKDISLNTLESPMFLNQKSDLESFFRKDKKKYHQTSFYIDERKRRKILLDNQHKPEGGKWSFDTENRKKYPKGQLPPPLQFPSNTSYYEEAKQYVDQEFKQNYGELTQQQLYPHNFDDTDVWLNQFFTQRFNGFGTYEDAILSKRYHFES